MAFVDGGKHFGQYTYEHWFDHEYGNKNDVTIQELKIDETEYVLNMVNNIFDEFIGKDYSEEGNNAFKESITLQNILNRINAKSSYFFVAKYGNEIIGMIGTKNKNHISLFFVKKEFQGKGIGKKLLEYYLDKIKKENIEIITVHSSIYAEKIYSKLGFKKTGEIEEKNGIKYIPMEYKL
jgi:GNAT superfamily N-acetyltransferase